MLDALVLFIVDCANWVVESLDRLAPVETVAAWMDDPETQRKEE